jgi:hypothetical protein
LHFDNLVTHVVHSANATRYIFLFILYYSTLVNLFMYDVKFLYGAGTTSPKCVVFTEQVLAQLWLLRCMVLDDVASGASECADNNGVTADLPLDQIDKAEAQMDVDTAENKDGENGNSEKDVERKSLINLCKTGLSVLI